MKMNKYVQHKQQRRGFTITETLFGLVCISLVMAAMVSVTVFLRNSATSVRANALLETYAVSVAETIEQDLKDGVDITHHNYNEDDRLENASIRSQINIDWESDVFGEMLYQVEIVCEEKKSNTTSTIRFFMRGGAY